MCADAGNVHVYREQANKRTNDDVWFQTGRFTFKRYRRRILEHAFGVRPVEPAPWLIHVAYKRVV